MRFSLVILHLVALLCLDIVHAKEKASEDLHTHYVVHGSRSDVPHGWMLTKRHVATEALLLRFGLRQSNMDKLDAMLMDVSDPSSPNYGRHWTPERVAKTFAPTQDTLNSMRGWLLGSGFPSSRIRISSTKGWIQVNATVEEAEKLLQTEYQVYARKTGEVQVGKQYSSCSSARFGM